MRRDAGTATGAAAVPVVSVVVTHYRSPHMLAECLAAIAHHLDPSSAEVVVCDSAAVPGHRTLVGSLLPDARYVGFRENVGFSVLVNAGVAATRAPYVLVLNADVELTAPVVDEMVRFLDSNDDVGMVGPQLVNEDGSRQESAFSFYRPSTVLYRRTPLGRTRAGRTELDRFLGAGSVARARAQGQPVDVDWLMGAAVMVKRAAVEEAGPLDEGFFLYFEDVDWCLRFWQASWRVVLLPTVECRHGLSRASKRRGPLDVLTNPLTRTHLRSAARFFAKHGTVVPRPLLDRTVSRPGALAHPDGSRPSLAAAVAGAPAERSPA